MLVVENTMLQRSSRSAALALTCCNAALALTDVNRSYILKPYVNRFYIGKESGLNPDSRGRVTEVWIVQPPRFLRVESIDPAPRQCCDVIRL